MLILSHGPSQVPLSSTPVIIMRQLLNTRFLPIYMVSNLKQSIEETFFNLMRLQ